MNVRALLGLAIFTWVSHAAHGTLVQPVPVPEDESTSPQIQISGVGLGVAGFSNSPEQISTGTINGYRGSLDFSDSALFLGAAQRLYENGGMGSLGFGAMVPDDGSAGVGNSLFIHQGFLDYQTENVEWLVGRSDNPVSHLVDFPTIREENLIVYTNPLNPFSNGANLEELRYSNAASVTFNQGLTYFENFHVQHLIDSRAAGDSPSVINSFGATLQYLAPPAMEALVRIASAGVGFEHQTVGNGGINQALGGGVINLNRSLTDRIDFRAQGIVNFGSSLSALANLTDSFQASYHGVAAAIRYLHSPFGHPGFQLSLTGGYRSYFAVAQATGAGLALTAVRRLGEGFDIVAQVRGEWRERQLAAVYQGQTEEYAAEIGFVFNFSALFNEHLSPRRSLLNFQHRYIPD